MDVPNTAQKEQRNFDERKSTGYQGRADAVVMIHDSTPNNAAPDKGRETMGRWIDPLRLQAGPA